MNERTEGIGFPVYVLAKDCGDVMEFSSQAAMERQLEAIDIENGEYEAWNANGNRLQLKVSEQKGPWLQIMKTKDRISESEFSVLRKRAAIPRSIRS